MTIELPVQLETALKARANAEGISVTSYVQVILERELAPNFEAPSSVVPFKTGYGMLAKYGKAPSAEEIDANRAEMFKNFGEAF
jgi:hypothetical protein